MEKTKNIYHLCPHALHAGVVALFMKYGEEAIKDIPHEIGEGDFERIFEKFCKKFYKMMPDCPHSEYYGIWDGLNTHDFALSEEDVTNFEKRHYKKFNPVTFVFNESYTMFEVMLPIYGSMVLSGATKGCGYGNRIAESSGFFTYQCFYDLGFQNPLSKLSEGKLGNALAQSAAYAFDIVVI